MASLGDSMGEGKEQDTGDKFVSTGYGTYQGQGNVETNARDQKGTGYDEHGQVKTSFGKWPISYEPSTGTASVQAEDLTPTEHEMDTAPLAGQEFMAAAVSAAMAATVQRQPAPEMEPAAVEGPGEEEAAAEGEDDGDGGQAEPPIV